MNEVFNADDVLGSEGVRNDVVVGQGDALLVNLTVTTFVDEVRDGLEGGLTVGDVGLDATEHGHGGVVDFEKDSVVKLTQAQKTHDAPGLGVHAHDTADTDDKEDLGFRRNVEVAGVLSLALHAGLVALHIPVFLDVFLGALELFLADASLCLQVISQVKTKK